MEDARLVDTLDPALRPTLAEGTAVEVRNRFCAAWSDGFEVAEATRAGYRVRRRSDRYVLPAEFLPTEVRRAAQGYVPSGPASGGPSPGASVSTP